MPSLKDKGIALLGSLAGVDMKTAASTTIFTTPIGRVTRITSVVVYNASASLAVVGSSYSITNWRQNFSLNALATANTGFIRVVGADLAQYTEIAGGTAVQITVNTGPAGAATATIDVFGYTTLT